MSERTTCPMCQGPAIPDGQTYVWTGSGDALRHPSQIQTRYRSTAVDPAQVQAMRELLWEIGGYLDAADHHADVGPPSFPTMRSWYRRIADLLGGAP